MKIVMLSNYFNHHQKPLSDSFNCLTECGYSFIEAENMDNTRRTLGWRSDISAPYVCSADNEKSNICINEADVIIAGSFPEKAIHKCIVSDRTVFRYSERPLKKGSEPAKFIPRFFKWHYLNPPGKSVYMLCASAFTAGDYRKFGLFKNRCFKWGYFPETIHYDDLDGLLKDKTANSILWCGRFLDWKHPDDALKIAFQLKKEGIDFHLKMIGSGPMENELRRMIDEYGISDCAELLGSMPPEQVRQHMEKSGILLFTSDRKEGWGAVLNEAMNSGCAVVASHAAGSVPYLVKDKESGLVYHSGDTEELYGKAKQLLANPDKQRKLGEAAYHTVADLWNAETAAQRFVQLSQAIMDGDKYPNLFQDGPCSIAEIIREDWYRG